LELKTAALGTYVSDKTTEFDATDRVDGGTNVRKQTATLSLFCFCVAIVMVLQASLLPYQYQLFSVFFTVHLALYAYPFFHSRPFDWFEPPVMASAFAVLSQYRILYLVIYRNFHTDFLALPLEQSVSLGIKVLCLTMLATICYYLGYYTNYGARWSLGIPVPKSEWSWNRTRLVIIIGGVLAGLCIMILTWKAGGPIKYLTNLGYWKVQTRIDGMETYRRGIYVLPFLGVLWFTYHKTQAKSRATLPQQLKFWLGLSLLFLASILGGSRSFIVIPALALLMLTHYLRKRISLVKMVFLGGAAILFATVYLQYRIHTGQFSREITQPTIGVSIITERSYDPVGLLNEAVGDRRGFDQLMYRVETTRVPEDLKWGQTYLYLLLTPIPRSLWTGKKAFYDSVSAEVIAFAPPGYLGELYSNFFIPGIIIGYFLWGAVQRSAYRWLIRNTRNKSVVITYVVFMVLIQEPTMNALATGLPIFVLFVFLIRYITKRPPKDNALKNRFGCAT
jgi:hypothetical protein